MYFFKNKDFSSLAVCSTLLLSSLSVFISVQFNYFTTFLGNKMHLLRCIYPHIPNRMHWKGLRKYFCLPFFLQSNCRKSFCIALCAHSHSPNASIHRILWRISFLIASVNGLRTYVVCILCHAINAAASITFCEQLLKLWRWKRFTK